jgi:uncharacterized membrane protein
MSELQESALESNVGPLERAVSAAAGAGLILYCLTRQERWKAVSFLLGADLLFRGFSGYSLLYELLDVRTSGPARDYKRGVKVSEMVTINRSPEELYRLWRNFENMPKIMRHVESVETLDESRSRWKARGPAGSTVSWDAEIVRDIPDKLITWQSLPNAPVIHAGSVSFERMPGSAGTEVKAILRYSPPGGAVGAAALGLLGEDPDRQVREDLKDFKRRVEFGELASLIEK